jgi:FtsP/CotA-like multicopper oxidase with cupredoxin domain
MSRRRLLAGAGAAAAHLAILAAARAQAAADGFRVLRASDKVTGAAWGYDGVVPGPALRLKRGEELRVRLFNDLAVPTTLHWHGVRTPNAMHGTIPLFAPAIATGTSFDYRFRVPDAGTFWYHAQAAEQIDRGLYGALIVEEIEPVAVDRDIVLVLGMPGDADGVPFRVNGAIRPDIAVKRGERLRLRLINATAARGLALKVEGHAPWVMAIDGQPSEPFRARDSRVGLAPGGRTDLFIDMVQENGAATPLVAGIRDGQPIARLVYERGGEARPPSRPDPLPLPANPLPPRIDLKTSLRTELSLANPKPLDPAGPPLFTVKRGRAVTLAVRNPAGRPQVVHLHGHSFRLLDRLDDGWKPYWLDTLVVGEEIERLGFVADNPGKWPIVFRPLEQRDSDGAVWFAVT